MVWHRKCYMEVCFNAEKILQVLCEEASKSESLIIVRYQPGQSKKIDFRSITLKTWTLTKTHRLMSLIWMGIEIVIKMSFSKIYKLVIEIHKSHHPTGEIHLCRNGWECLFRHLHV